MHIVTATPMTGMLAGPDAAAAAVLCAAVAALGARAEPGADAPPPAWSAYALLALLCVLVNTGALAAEAVWQRTVERAWNEACARRRKA